MKAKPAKAGDAKPFFCRMVINHPINVYYRETDKSRGRKKGKYMLRNFKVMLTVLVVLVLAGGAYAFAAQNYVPAQTAGDGAAAVTGVNIDNIVYSLDRFGGPFDEGFVDQVSFTVSPQNDGPQPSGVEIQLNSHMGEWFSCEQQGTSTTWACNTMGFYRMADVNQLRVAAHTNASFNTFPMN
jgi:hypothetical protein